jgi:hypothetical protein
MAPYKPRVLCLVDDDVEEPSSVLSLFAYHWSHGSWPQFAFRFLVPDVSMLG